MINGLLRFSHFATCHWAQVLPGPNFVWGLLPLHIFQKCLANGSAKGVWVDLCSLGAFHSPLVPWDHLVFMIPWAKLSIQGFEKWRWIGHDFCSFLHRPFWLQWHHAKLAHIKFCNMNWAVTLEMLHLSKQVDSCSMQWVGVPHLLWIGMGMVIVLQHTSWDQAFF